LDYQVNSHHILFIKDCGRRSVFNIFIHYPESIKAQQELMKKAAEIHAQTVIEMVKSMPYSGEQKVRLIDAVKAYIPK